MVCVSLLSCAPMMTPSKKHSYDRWRTGWRQHLGVGTAKADLKAVLRTQHRVRSQSGCQDAESRVYSGLDGTKFERTACSMHCIRLACFVDQMLKSSILRRPEAFRGHAARCACGQGVGVEQQTPPKHAFPSGPEAQETLLLATPCQLHVVGRGLVATCGRSHSLSSLLVLHQRRTAAACTATKTGI